MNDPHPSLTTIGAVVLWLSAVALAMFYVTTGARGTGAVSVILSAGAATLTIRGFLIAMADDLIARERAAFEIGQDSQRMRSVT